MILDQLAQAARQRVAAEHQKESEAKLLARAEALGRERAGCFYRALTQPGLQIIAEVKKASPSKGLIAPNFPYLEIARTYEKAGAAAISVLTEPTRFLGSDQYLKEIRQVVQLPLLRKDFTVDPYQILQAKCLGADAVLLIAALLGEEELREFRQLAEHLGLDALVEVHDAKELERALGSGARILGVNNRNLKNFTVNVRNSLQLRKLAPRELPFVAESGITGRAQTRELEQAGVSAVLVGELLMRSGNPGRTLRQLKGEQDDPV